jgi:hypothetical protein
MNHKGPIYVACTLLATVLIGAGTARFPVEYDPQTGIIYPSNLTLLGTGTFGHISGDGSPLTGVQAESTTNWLPNLIVTGRTDLGPTYANGIGITNISTNAIPGLSALISGISGAAGTNWFSSITVTGAAALGNSMAGNGAGITNISTNAIPGLSQFVSDYSSAQPTNWFSSLVTTGNISSRTLSTTSADGNSYITGRLFAVGTTIATNSLNQFGGSGALLTFLRTNAVTGLMGYIQHGVSAVTNIKSFLSDIDTIYPQTNVGGASAYDGDNGGEWNQISGSVFPIYSNVFSTIDVMGPGMAFEGADLTKATVGWVSQPGADAYYVYSYMAENSGPTTEYFHGIFGASVTNTPLGSDWTNRVSAPSLPSSYNQTNEVTIAWTNGLVTASVTNGLAGPSVTNGLQQALTSSGIVNFDVIPTTTNAIPATNCQTVTIFNGTNFTLCVFQGTNFFSLGPGFGVGPLGGIGGNSSNISISASGGSITGATWRFEQ